LLEHAPERQLQLSLAANLAVISEPKINAVNAAKIIRLTGSGFTFPKPFETKFRLATMRLSVRKISGRGNARHQADRAAIVAALSSECRVETSKGFRMRDLSAALRNQPPAEHAYDWDPLHMPGYVQAYGVLLVADAETRQVQFVSENASDVLGITADDILDRSYLALCDGERERSSMKDSISADTILFPNPFRMTIKGRIFDAVVHNHGGLHMIEVEPSDQLDSPYADMASRAVEELNDPSSIEELYQRAVRMVRQVTGFDRVMLYRFDSRYNGQVLAEATRDGIGSFLGLFFPSGDISGRARELYLKNFTRYIPDIGGATHRMLGRSSSAAACVDMTHTNLRSVAPCHIGYLQNMGVNASMSFSINVDDRLWGLFACHHYSPRRVSYEERVVCEQTAMMFIFKLNALNSHAARLAQRATGVEQLGRTLAVGAALTRRIAVLDTAWSEEADKIIARPMLMQALAAIHAENSWLLATDAAMASGGATDAAAENDAPITDSQRLLLSLVEADSAAIVRYGRVRRIGDAPPDMAIYAIASMFGRELPDLQHGNLPIFATDNLTGVAPVAGGIKDRAAGVLAVSLSDDVPAYLIWFRREQIVKASWAGNPADESHASGAKGSNPRASFAAWKNDIRDLSPPWTIEDLQIAHDLMAAIRSADGALPVCSAPSQNAPWSSPKPTQARTMLASHAPGNASSVPITSTSTPVPSPTGRRVIRVGQM
jgi:chemotaxis family two-component system sensor kinase Cph1